MSESEIKLELIRLIDKQGGKILIELYELVQEKLNTGSVSDEEQSPLEKGYKEMSEDLQREKDAFEWIEGTLNSDGI